MLPPTQLASSAILALISDQPVLPLNSRSINAVRAGSNPAFFQVAIPMGSDVFANTEIVDSVANWSPYAGSAEQDVGRTDVLPGIEPHLFCDRDGPKALNALCGVYP